jgi:hypothetical protein
MSDLSVTSSGSGQATCGLGNDHVTQVARVVGGEDKMSIRAQALDCINRVVDRLSRRDWRFLKTTASAITLVNGTKTYTLPTAFKSPSYARLLDTGGVPDHDLVYVDDAWWSHSQEDQENTGQPLYYLLRNAFGDGLVTVFPTPDTSAATNWTLSVEYFKRFPKVTDDATEIAIPEEVCDVLIVGGQAYLLREREKGSPVAAQAYADYRDILKDIETYDRRIADEQPRFRMGRQRMPVGTVYIRVP